MASAASKSVLTVKEFFANKLPPKIVSICGSQRVGSYNRMLYNHANDVLTTKFGATVHPIELQDLNLPLYNPNIETDGQFPPSAQHFKESLTKADGIFIASPEYNGFTTPLLYNAITWATRGNGDMYDGFRGKVVTVMATSPGPMGGLRMIRSMNTLLQDMGCIVVPGANAIGSAMTVFEEKEGTITDERTIGKIETTCERLVQYCRYEANRETDCQIAREVLKNMGEYGSVDLPKNS